MCILGWFPSLGNSQNSRYRQGGWRLGYLALLEPYGLETRCGGEVQEFYSQKSP
jgi:hypothetical protein